MKTAIGILEEYAEQKVREARIAEARKFEVVIARGQAAGAIAEARHYEKLYRKEVKDREEQVATLRQIIAELEASSEKFAALEAVLPGALDGADMEALLKSIAVGQQQSFALLNAQIEQLKLEYPKIALDLGFMG